MRDTVDNSLSQSDVTHYLARRSYKQQPIILERDMMRLTVLDIAEWFGDTSGGVRTYLLAKSAYVRNHERFRQILVVPGPNDERSEDGAVSTYRLRGPRLPRRGQYRLLLAVASLRRIIEREQPDVIEVGSMMLAPWVLAIASRGRRAPRIAFYHENVERRFAFPRGQVPAWRELSRGPLRWYLRQVDRLFDGRVVASTALSNDLEDAGLTNVTRVPLGVDVAVFDPTRRAYAAITRTALDLPSTGAIVGYVGRLAAEKELPLLLNAWPVIEKASDASLLIMGDGPLVGRVKEMSRHHRVYQRPFIADRSAVADTLAMIDVFVTPGSIETFGLAQLEAMACGTPAVAPSDGGAAELILSSGAGRRFESGNANGLAQTVTELLGDPELRRRLGANGRRAAERDHSWEHVFDTLFSYYGELQQQYVNARPLGKRLSRPPVERHIASERDKL